MKQFVMIVCFLAAAAFLGFAMYRIMPKKHPEVACQQVQQCPPCPQKGSMAGGRAECVTGKCQCVYE